MSSSRYGWNFETVVAPEQKEEPLAWLSFRKASVYRQRDGIVFVTDWTEEDLRSRVQQ